MRVMIVGAGVAGLSLGHELVCAGHDVTLVEASRKVGGALHQASAAPMKSETSSKRVLAPKPLERPLMVIMESPTCFP